MHRSEISLGGMAVMVAAFLVSACVPYPIYKTLQPEASITVLDAANHPVAGAEVTLVSNAYPYGREKGRMTKTTEANGVASFQARREWRTEVLMIHGSEEFFWNWCIRKTGFATHVTSNRSASEFQRAMEVRLEPGVDSPCPSVSGQGRS